MRSRRILAIVILIPFSILSVYALTQVGYLYLFTYHLASPAGWQVFTDLVVALVLVSTWMIGDARRTGRNVWPYLVMTLLLGSIGPLVYLLLSPAKAVIPSGETART